MINTQLLAKRLRTAAFAAALLFGTSAVFAQVKIGTNPTSIDPANNLEVESSTAGRKTSINKTTGQITIADGTQGAAKILTSDMNGGASWQPPLAQNTELWVSASQSGTQAIPIGITRVLFNTEAHDRGDNFLTSTSQVTVATPGIYQISSGFRKNSPSASFNISLSFYVNNVLLATPFEDAWTDGAAQPRAGASTLVQLNAGDVIDVRVSSSFTNITIGQSYLTMIKLSN